MPERGTVGRLSIVSTPIGNLEDVTLRALRTLKDSDLILAEDTRLTRRLCSHYDIKTPLRSFHAHSSRTLAERYIQRIQDGEHLAFVTDAGTPVISDPGSVLVQCAIDCGIIVESIPGPSAITAALSVSGIGCDSFRFIGFLPRSGGRRKELLESIARAAECTVLFESPQRIAQTLADMGKHIEPERHVALCRELTKIHEEVVNSTLGELALRFSGETRGEITLVVAGRERESEKEVPLDLDQTILTYLNQGMTPRDVARTIARECALPRKAIYARVVALKT
jgi:16S rRNA (cytidine1402-2'-O)-methyltransferase